MRTPHKASRGSCTHALGLLVGRRLVAKSARSPGRPREARRYLEGTDISFEVMKLVGVAAESDRAGAPGHPQ